MNTNSQRHGPATLATISQQRFSIPLYQRPYAWEDRQVSQLLKDLHDAFRKSPVAHYHLGILSVANNQADSGYDLIDGQQRVATLMLIGKVARQHCKEWDAVFANQRLRFYGRQGDQDYLDKNDDRNCNRRMTAVVEETQRFFNNHISAPGERAAFAEFIYKHAAFFLAEALPGYSPADKNQQFVRMNNRGKQLEKHEILKVQLLRHFNGNPLGNGALAAWNTMLDYLTGSTVQEDVPQKLESILTNDGDGERVEHESKNANCGEMFQTAIVSVPEFLLIALARYRKSRVSQNPDRLLETFDASLLKDKNAIPKFMDVLSQQTELLKAFFIYLSKNGKDSSYELGTTTPRLFKCEEGYDIEQRVIAIQSFLHVSTAPHHWLIPALDWCQRFLGKTINASQFVAELERIDNDLIHCPEGRNLSSIATLEDMKYPNVRHYWFYRLDYELWKRFHFPREDDTTWSKLSSSEEGNSVRKLVKDFRFRPCGSVEHIYPRQQVDTPQSPADDSFGNLALISSGRNSKFSNGVLAAKKEMILRTGDQPYTESLKMVHFLWCNCDPNDHGREMYNLLPASARRDVSDGGGRDSRVAMMEARMCAVCGSCCTSRAWGRSSSRHE